MAKNTLNSKSNGAAIGVGVGIAALAAAAAGAYYLYGSDAAKSNRKAVKSWMLKAKADVMDEIENMKEVNEGAYKEAVAKIGKKYQDIKGMDKEELAELVSSLQGHWKDIKAEIEKAGTTVKTAKHTTHARNAAQKKK
ncbi:MAG: hypothetical protein P4L61_03740 [Candidatus Pacebacteria bacterium]|nr:hypothetical protein [Candidatus Paceibacterota bacterium]